MSDQSPSPQNPGQPYGEQPYQPPYGEQASQQQPYTQPYPQQPYGQYQQPYGQYQQPYGQYPQSYTQPYAVAARPTNTMAVVALIAGIAGFTLVPFIGSIVAVITGPMARRQIRETGENGDGMALAGLIVGWAGVGLWIVVALAIILPLVIFASAASVTTLG